MSLLDLRLERAKIMGGTKTKAPDADRMRNFELDVSTKDCVVIAADISDDKAWMTTYTLKKGARKGQQVASIKHCDCTEYGKPMLIDTPNGEKWLTFRITDKAPSE